MPHSLVFSPSCGLATLGNIHVSIFPQSLVVGTTGSSHESGIGCRKVNVRVSTKPVLMAPDEISVTPLTPLRLDTVGQVPAHLSHADEVLTHVLSLLHAPSLRLSWPGDPVAGMRHATSVADGETRGVVHMPRFARSPNRVERHWLAYTLNTAVALAAARFLYVNSPLNGSDNLQRWVSHGYTSTVRGFRCAPDPPLSPCWAVLSRTRRYDDDATESATVGVDWACTYRIELYH